MGNVSQNRIVKAESATTITNLTDSIIKDDGSGTILINPVTPADAIIHLNDAWGGGNGKNLTIWGACAAQDNCNGGHIFLNPGSPDGSGNPGGVGIFNSSPSCALDVVGTVKASTALVTPAIKPATDSTTALQVQKSDGSSVVNVNTTDKNIQIGQNPDWTLTVLGDICAGRVHLGLGDMGVPDYLLEVGCELQSGSEIDAIFGSGKGSGQCNICVGTDDSQYSVMLGSDIDNRYGSLHFANQSFGSMVVLHNNGYVGIGSTSPTSKLDVNGNIKASGSVQFGNNTGTASASLVGSIRYRTSGNNSYVDVCMQYGSGLYRWENIKTLSW